MRKIIVLVMVVILSTVSEMGINYIEAKENCGYIKLGREEVKSFTDAFFEEYMVKYHIPGAAVSIVQGDEVVYEKAYGKANIEKAQIFTTDDTYFSIASITKTFTAMAIMKLVEEGKINLEEDICTYVPTLKIENPYPEPVTVKQLLTHTAGIDSSYTEDLSYEKTNNEARHNLLNLINKRGVKVVNRPGEAVAYSSYGMVLLGVIVEEVSGMSCEAYFKTHIFLPLEMAHTSILSPEVERLQGYIYQGEKLMPSELKGYFNLYPEGGIVSNVADMTHYLIMLLGEGKYKDKKIIEADTIKEMLTTKASFDEAVPGMGYGFAEYENDGVRSMGHAGYAPDGTLSELVIFSESQIGTFMVVNQGSNSNIQADFREAFVKTFMKDTIKDSEVSLVAPQGQAVSTKALDGIYRFSDYSRSNLYKANTFGGGEIEIKSVDEEHIVVRGKEDFTFVPYEKKAELIAGLTYKFIDSDEYIVFKKDEKGKIRYCAETENSSHGSYEKLKWYEQSRWQMPFFMIALVIYCIQLIGALILAIRRRLQRIMKKEKSSSCSKESWIINGIAFLNVGFFVYSMGFWGDRLRYTIPSDILISLAMPILSCAATLLLGVSMFYNRGKIKQRKCYQQIYLGMMLGLSIVFVLFLNYWNFIGFKL